MIPSRRILSRVVDASSVSPRRLCTRTSPQTTSSRHVSMRMQVAVCHGWSKDRHGDALLLNAFTISDMSTEKGKKKRGRPPGQTAQGLAARQLLYHTAIQLIGERGFEETTLRDVA